MYSSPFYQQFNQIDICNNIYNNYFATMMYMQAMQAQSMYLSRMAPVQVLINNNFKRDPFCEEKLSQSQKNSEKSTFEEVAMFPSSPVPSTFLKMAKNVTNFSSFRQKENRQERKISSKYLFTTIASRKKEKKSIKLRLNRIISRVHNMDCLLKKIKAKYLKFLFTDLRSELSALNVELRKFDQCAEVRNLNVAHNRDNFIDLSILQMLLNNSIIRKEDIDNVVTYSSNTPSSLLNKKVKYHYQFDFLCSKYFKNWIRDPIKINRLDCKIRPNAVNKNCIKFPNHSKNIFSKNKEDYDIYIKLLMQTSCNFVFYFQNNPLKFGKKAKNFA